MLIYIGFNKWVGHYRASPYRRTRNIQEDIPSLNMTTAFRVSLIAKVRYVSKSQAVIVNILRPYQYWSSCCICCSASRRGTA